MVEAGFGLALLPESSIEEELRAGTLRVVNVTAMRVTLPVALIHRRRAYLGAAARTLIDDLTACPKWTTAARQRRRNIARISASPV